MGKMRKDRRVQGRREHRECVSGKRGAGGDRTLEKFGGEWDPITCTLPHIHSAQHHSCTHNDHPLTLSLIHSYMRTLTRRFKNGFREGTKAPARKQ